MSEVLKQLPIRFPKHESMSIWFFSQTRRSSPLFRMNMQNNQVYLSTTVRKCDISASRLLHACPTFSHSVMVLLAICKLGCMQLFFFLIWYKNWRCGEGIVSRKPRPKSVHDFHGLLYCFVVLLCICVVSCPYMIYYPTVIARYSIFVLKVPLNPKQTTNKYQKWSSEE